MDRLQKSAAQGEQAAGGGMTLIDCVVKRSQ
jgi:hypothetical protein